MAALLKRPRRRTRQRTSCTASGSEATSCPRKQARGFLQLRLRGLRKARGEWALPCLTHNLHKLHGARVAASSSGYPPAERGAAGGSRGTNIPSGARPPVEGQAALMQ
jgi:hypothetical protein